jgi:hypothetical protein
LEKLKCHITPGGGGYGPLVQNDTGGRGGVKNQSKKCHVLLEWPLN